MKRFRSKKNNKDTAVRRPYIARQEHSVFSYYGAPKNADPESGRQRRVPAYRQAPERSGRRFRWSHLPAYLATLAIVVSVLYTFQLSNNPQVVMSPLSSGGTYRSVLTYQQAASKSLQASIWSRNKLTINTKALEASLKRQFPELETVTIAIPLISHRPVIGLTLANPAAVFIAPNSSVVIGNSGQVLLAVKEADPAALKTVPVIHEELERKLEPGNFALTTQDVAFIKTVLASLNSKGRTPDTFTMPTIASEIHITLKGQPYFIKLYMQGDANLQMGAFYAVEAKLKEEGRHPTEYIDVRLGERAFIK